MDITITEEILTGICHLDGNLFLNMRKKEERMKLIQLGKREELEGYLEFFKLQIIS